MRGRDMFQGFTRKTTYFAVAVTFVVTRLAFGDNPLWGVPTVVRESVVVQGGESLPPSASGGGNEAMYLLIAELKGMKDEMKRANIVVAAIAPPVSAGVAQSCPSCPDCPSTTSQVAGVAKAEECICPVAATATECPVCPAAAAKSDAAADEGDSPWGEGSSSSGKLWSPVKLRDSDIPIEPFKKAAKPWDKVGKLSCEQWVVTTTIFSPTLLAEQVLGLDDWCMVVVGDKKTPNGDWNKLPADKAVFLSSDDQETLPYAIVPLLKWNHFGRKNIGFMYAVHHGAKVIYDTDDDNFLNTPTELTSWAELLHDSTTKQPVLQTVHHVCNPYPMFGSARNASTLEVAGGYGKEHELVPHFVWPRGLPLDLINDQMTHMDDTKPTNGVNIGVVQSLADHDPDIDGLYRLTQVLPLRFTGRDQPVLVLPEGTMTPFNAQAVLFGEGAFWGILLPVTVHGRVTDIWRSYFTQRQMWDIGMSLSFSNPFVTQYRNPHNYLADFESEIPLYSQSGELIKHLLKFQSTTETTDLPTRMRELYKDMYEIGILEHDDLKLMQAWVDDLANVGYSFPPITNHYTQKQSTSQ